MGIPVHKEPCPACRAKGNDRSGNNLQRYKDNSAYCFACHYCIPSDDIKEGRKVSEGEEELNKIQEAILLEETEKITPEQRNALKARTTSNRDWRGIRAETALYFGVRYQCNEETGEITHQYYPVTQKNELVGYKVRKLPKEFIAPIGYSGKQADFLGQFRFSTSSRTCIIVGGEVDQLSAYQMLRDYQVRAGKEEFEPTAVVSSVVGEGSTAAQAKLQYKFFDQFSKIIICLDSDEAGQAAVEKLVPVLPKGKVFIMKLKFKDANEYLQKGEDRSFIDAFFRAQQYVPAGIVSSTQLYERLLDTANQPKIPLPKMLKTLQDMMAGGVPLGYLLNIGAGTGAAKTTVINECIYYWLFNSPYKVGIVSCELDAGQYAEALLSRHMQRKIALIASVEEREQFLKSDAVKAAAQDLFVNEEGQERFSLVDDRNGTLEQLQRLVEEMIRSCGCQLIILDPIQDLIGNLSNEEQGEFMSWQKGLLKSHHCTIINVNHLRKQPHSPDTKELRMPTEDDFHGSSTIMKSGGANILMARNKYAEDPIERNTTYLQVSKLRWTGLTGPAGKLYYDNSTHTMYDFDEWFKHNTLEGSSY